MNGADSNDPFAPLLDVHDVARLLKITPKGVYSMVEARRIPFVKVSNRLRFRSAELRAWIDANCVAPRQPRRAPGGVR